MEVVKKAYFSLRTKSLMLSKVGILGLWQGGGAFPAPQTLPPTPPDLNTPQGTLLGWIHISPLLYVVPHEHKTLGWEETTFWEEVSLGVSIMIPPQMASGLAVTLGCVSAQGRTP